MRRRRFTFLLTGLAVAAACADASREAVDAAPITEGIVGRVIDATTGRPVAGAIVRAPGHMDGMSDSAGRYEAEHYWTQGGDSVPVIARRLGYATARTIRRRRASGLDTLDVALVPGAPVGLRPTGRWRMRLSPLDTSHCTGTRAGRIVLEAGTTRAVEAAIEFRPEVVPSPDLELPVVRDLHLWTLFGHTDLDMGALLERRPGAIEAPGRDQRVLRPRWRRRGQWEVIAWSFGADSLGVQLLASGSHFGLSIQGQVRGDTVIGRWTEFESYDCYPSGPAVLWPTRR